MFFLSCNFISENSFPATSAMSYPSGNPISESWLNTLRTLLVRFLWTEFLEVLSEQKRNLFPEEWFLLKITRMLLELSRIPSWNRDRISILDLRVSLFPDNQIVLEFLTDLFVRNGEFVSSLQSSSRQNSSSANSRHARTESVCSDSFNLTGLICSFHIFTLCGP